MADIQDTLTDKVGPLPVWGWGLILGGIAVAFMWFNRGDTSSENGYVPPASVGAGGGIDPYGDSGLYTGNNGGDQYSNDPGSDPSETPDNPDKTTRIRNNTQWLAAGVAYLTGRGHTALLSQRALSKYLAGKPLTTTQQAFVNSTVAGIGLPPNPPTIAPPVKSKPGESDNEDDKPDKPHKPKGGKHPPKGGKHPPKHPHKDETPHKPKPGTKPKPKVIRAKDPVIHHPKQSQPKHNPPPKRHVTVSRHPSPGGGRGHGGGHR